MRYIDYIQQVEPLHQIINQISLNLIAYGDEDLKHFRPALESILLASCGDHVEGDNDFEYLQNYKGRKGK